MNSKMKDLLYCEFYKINRKHTLLKLAIAIVVISLAMMGFSALIKGVLGDSLSLGSALRDYDEQIESLKMQMEAINNLGGGWRDNLIIGNTAAAYQAQINIFQYLKDHGVPQGSVVMFSENAGIFDFDSYSFTQMCMSALMSVIIIFMIVACCNTTSGEFSNGAMKMQFIRPVNKNKFFTAKWLSVVIVSEILAVISFLLSLILGLILYGPVSPNVAFVAGSAVTVVSPFGALMLTLMLNMIKIFFLTQLTMFLCSLFNTFGKAIVLSLLLIVFDFGVYLEYVLALPYVGYLAFFANSNWASGISASAPIFRGMTIWVMIPVTLIWCAFFMWFSYRRFNKREV